MNFKLIFEKIDFSNRYRLLCDRFDNFEDSLDRANKAFCSDVLDKFNYKYKYISNGGFFQIIEELPDIEFMLNLVLKKGHVESLLYINIEGQLIEANGRLDFIPQTIGIPFERKEYNLPLFACDKDLEEILKEIFSIYEDLKKEILVKYVK